MAILSSSKRSHPKKCLPLNCSLQCHYDMPGSKRGLLVDLQILNNKASTTYKEVITFKWNAKLQPVSPDMHHPNRAECDIHKFKDHFLAILDSVNSALPLYLCDLLLPQAELTLNLLRQATLNLRISATEFFPRSLQLQQDSTWSGWLSQPHPCKASYQAILEFPCKTRFLHWPCS
jgi:hypothetical protein